MISVFEQVSSDLLKSYKRTGQGISRSVTPGFCELKLLLLSRESGVRKRAISQAIRLQFPVGNDSLTARVSSEYILNIAYT